MSPLSPAPSRAPANGDERSASPVSDGTSDAPAIITQGEDDVTASSASPSRPHSPLPIQGSDTETKLEEPISSEIERPAPTDVPVPDGPDEALAPIEAPSAAGERGGSGTPSIGSLPPSLVRTTSG